MDNTKLVATRLAITDQRCRQRTALESEVTPGSSLVELGRSPCTLAAYLGVVAHMQQRKQSLQVRSPAAASVRSIKRIHIAKVVELNGRQTRVRLSPWLVHKNTLGFYTS